MEWVYLILAVILETIGTTFMKMSDGFTKPLLVIGTLLSYCICFTFFAISLKKIPISVAYAIWGATGIVIVSAMGIFVFKESVSILKIVSLLFIVVGVIGVNLSGVSH
ncbi:multidrug efflux SMR transporter [Clostridium estertheticum]|uniref:DMT family transporter n=1 Tax=Clostridium estertheticum TaxID=238834 RepID=UPI001C0ACACA|nr:multidrug efflux SMR transporter [Clostridium estertheticum]MBU3201758.1 multidrug efflux SMR transporter [Clostridium estertheticum]WAG67113.1 multidrug efflux SMR transporter [Clostridium estertheticum]